MEKFRMEKIVCNFIAVYRKTYSSNHVLIRLTENWKTTSWQEKDRDSSYGSIKNISTNDCKSQERPKQICIKYKLRKINHGIMCHIIRYRNWLINWAWKNTSPIFAKSQQSTKYNLQNANICGSHRKRSNNKYFHAFKF